MNIEDILLKAAFFENKDNSYQWFIGSTNGNSTAIPELHEAIQDKLLNDPSSINFTPFAVNRSDLIDKVRSELSKACENEIVSGFTSSVLSANCNYRSCRDQQRTIESAARRTGGGKIWMNGSFTHHTQAQAQQVLEECEIHIENIRTKFADKVVYISDPSRTDSEIEACTWDSLEV